MEKNNKIMNTCIDCGAEFGHNYWDSSFCSFCRDKKVEIRSFSVSQLKLIDEIKKEAENQEDYL